jgi:predicted ArsR family transcriptional regulator
MLSRSVDSSWAKELIVALNGEAETPAKGWLTSEEIAEQLAVKRPQATKHIGVLRSRGLILERQYRRIVNTKYAIVRKVMHYKLLKDATPQERAEFGGKEAMSLKNQLQAQSEGKIFNKNHKKRLTDLA